MPELDKLTASDFMERIDETFNLVAADGHLPLQVASVKVLGTAYAGSEREPFAVYFKIRSGLRIPQATYRIESSTLGSMEIFLVQISVDTVEAIFT